MSSKKIVRFWPSENWILLFRNVWETENELWGPSQVDDVACHEDIAILSKFNAEFIP